MLRCCGFIVGLQFDMDLRHTTCCGFVDCCRLLTCSVFVVQEIYDESKQVQSQAKCTHLLQIVS